MGLIELNRCRATSPHAYWSPALTLSSSYLCKPSLRLVVSLLSAMLRGMLFLDLIRKVPGLIRAVEKFDYTKGL